MNCCITCQKLSKFSETCFTTTKETALASFNLAHPVHLHSKTRYINMWQDTEALGRRRAKPSKITCYLLKVLLQLKKLHWPHLTWPTRYTCTVRPDTSTCDKIQRHMEDGELNRARSKPTLTLPNATVTRATDSLCFTLSNVLPLTYRLTISGTFSPSVPGTVPDHAISYTLHCYLLYYHHHHHHHHWEIWT